MEIKIIFKNKEIIFGEWKTAGILDSLCFRRSAFPGTYVEWIQNHTKDGIYWFRNFQGTDDASGLYSLRYIYDRIHPSHLFTIDQVDEAKNHMDNFLLKINSLRTYL